MFWVGERILRAPLNDTRLTGCGRGRRKKAGASSRTPKWLGFAPFQLVAQDLEIGFLWRLDKFQQLLSRGRRGQESVGCKGMPRWPSRVRKKNGLGVPGEPHVDGRGVSDYEGGDHSRCEDRWE